jgi:uncharacterized protein YecE (DUF72 family)
MFPGMAKVWIGTSGFSYPEWSEIFYPKGMKADQYLGFYSQTFPIVEIDRTFYRMPSRDTLQSWKASTPDGFKFAIKASQKITHFERLKLPSGPLEYLMGVLPELGDRLGVVLYQTPPNLKLNLERLETFLANLPKSIPAAFEFRNDSWFVPEVYELLRKRKAALCITDDDDGTGPIELTAPFTYVRLRRTEYGPAERELWQARWREWTAGGVEVYAFLKHEDSPDAPNIAMGFKNEAAALAV